MAFPTETVYGLGADALNENASNKIYAAKGRPSDNPLIVHITNMGALDKIARYVSESSFKVADAYWPGTAYDDFPEDRKGAIGDNRRSEYRCSDVCQVMRLQERYRCGRRIYCCAKREYFRTSESRRKLSM